VVASDIEDHPDNARASVLIGREVVAAPMVTIARPSSASKTRPPGIFCTFILGRFAARDINLTRLESHPTKRGLGDYCLLLSSRATCRRRGGRLPR